jgi:hypothetical protein
MDSYRGVLVIYALIDAGIDTLRLSEQLLGDNRIIILVTFLNGFPSFQLNSIRLGDESPHHGSIGFDV